MKNFFLLFALLLSGCGYRFADNDLRQCTVSVPYVKGDLDGLFTGIFVRNLSEMGGYQYVRSGGVYSIEMEIINDENRQIGYKYDREETTGILIKRLEPTEERRIVTAKVQMINTRTCEIVKGPFTISAEADYDFVDQDSAIDVSFIAPNGRRTSVLDFSLGQLDSREGAREISRKPLFDILSYKIINALTKAL